MPFVKECQDLLVLRRKSIKIREAVEPDPTHCGHQSPENMDQEFRRKYNAENVHLNALYDMKAYRL